MKKYIKLGLIPDKKEQKQFDDFMIAIMKELPKRKFKRRFSSGGFCLFSLIEEEPIADLVIEDNGLIRVTASKYNDKQGKINREKGRKVFKKVLKDFQEYKKIREIKKSRLSTIKEMFDKKLLKYEDYGKREE